MAKTKTPKTNKFVVMTSAEATHAAMPRYNAFQGGYGAHGKRKYDRNATKRDFQKSMTERSWA